MYYQFFLLQKCIFRRLICDLPTNALNKFYVSLHRDIVKYDNSINRYLEKYIYTLLSKKDRLSFPLDKEFIKELSEKNIYSLNKKNKVYIFERFENGNTKEDKDRYSQCEDRAYNIEHMMPKKLSKIWKQELGSNYEKIHNKWLNRLANLTLTAYNSNYSNHPFSEKKNIEDGYKNSGIKLNQYIAKFDKWTLDELKERDKYLCNQALTLWEQPVTAYKPPKVEDTIISLSYNSNFFISKEITAFIYKGTEQQVSSWVEMFEAILNSLVNFDEKIFYDIANKEDDEYGLKVYITQDSSKLREFISINNNLFIEKNTSTHIKINIIKKLFDIFNISYQDLDFIIK